MWDNESIKYLIFIMQRAKLACKNSGFEIEDHFADVGKTIDMPKGAQKEIPDVMLSRYACYLIVMKKH